MCSKVGDRASLESYGRSSRVIAQTGLLGRQKRVLLAASQTAENLAPLIPHY
ncbi:hypothetical protein CROQUDRAFT_93995 [Cronartium quercuum f. sp. fusiforme G11]|uniref:Uncharacterized protein n=1 Tax=Cronartium quercuum f. sp. fusiforme G11 TaxID=708437 RepID=A0A9P6TB35_9BASI|nr:hypothetical protein CROQUDRAFT_93995 [Cronartium quercuum f. sp. fusiforme G11]